MILNIYAAPGRVIKIQAGRLKNSKRYLEVFVNDHDGSEITGPHVIRARTDSKKMPIRHELEPRVDDLVRSDNHLEACFLEEAFHFGPSKDERDLDVRVLVRKETALVVFYWIRPHQVAYKPAIRNVDRPLDGFE